MSYAYHILVVSDGIYSINLGGLQADLNGGSIGAEPPGKKQKDSLSLGRRVRRRARRRGSDAVFSGTSPTCTCCTAGTSRGRPAGRRPGRRSARTARTVRVDTFSNIWMIWCRISRVSTE